MSVSVFKKTYHYNAHAYGLSGEFSQPVQKLIEVQAATALPIMGGHGNSRVDKFKFEEFVTFEAAYSHVSGSQIKSDSSYTTLVTSVVEGLNILDMVTADRVVARASSEQSPDASEPRIIFLGSRFENLRIGGYHVELEIDRDLVTGADTFEKILNKLATDREFRKMAEDPYQGGPAQKIPDANGELLCSLVQTMKTNCPGVTPRGYAFTVPQFGKVFLGEVVAKRGVRTLTMLRVELGCPVFGSAAVTGIQINGGTWP